MSVTGFERPWSERPARSLWSPQLQWRRPPLFSLFLYVLCLGHHRSLPLPPSRVRCVLGLLCPGHLCRLLVCPLIAWHHHHHHHHLSSVFGTFPFQLLSFSLFATLIYIECVTPFSGSVSVPGWALPSVRWREEQLSPQLHFPGANWWQSTLRSHSQFFAVHFPCM